MMTDLFSILVDESLRSIHHCVHPWALVVTMGSRFSNMDILCRPKNKRVLCWLVLLLI